MFGGTTIEILRKVIAHRDKEHPENLAATEPPPNTRAFDESSDPIRRKQAELLHGFGLQVGMAYRRGGGSGKGRPGFGRGTPVRVQDIGNGLGSGHR
jgi:hypothetical protein